MSKSKQNEVANETVKIELGNADNQTFDSLDELKKIEYMDDRYTAMSTAPIRVAQGKYWDEADSQFTAISITDEYWELQASLPLEQNLIDAYEGRAAGKYMFDIQPNGKQANVDELQPAKYATEFFLEWWNNKGNWFYDEAPTMRRLKARYGTEFAFTGLDITQQIKYRIKKDKIKEINSAEDLENPANLEQYIVDGFDLFPKHIGIRNILVDEKALGQTNLHKAEDIIVEKIMSLDEMRLQRWENKSYGNLDKVTEDTPSDEKKSNKDVIAKNQVLVRFYYNIITKDYVVYVSSDNVILHRSKMLFDHGKFPMECSQHYSDDNCLYGIGIPRKVKYIKVFKSEFLQYLMRNASISSSVNFVVGNNWEVEDWNLGWWWVNVWRTSVWAEQIQPLQPQINTWLIAILNLLDDLVIQDTGENVRAPIDMQSDKVGIVEMMEENKATRHKSVDENWHLFMDRCLTSMISNIAQFVPAILSKTEEVKIWDKTVTKVIYPKITVRDAKVTKKGKWIKVDDGVDNYWEVWYFELKEDTIPQGLWVKVVTPSSYNSLPLIKKENISKWIENKYRLAELAALDQTWELMQKLKSNINIQDINDWMNDVYGFEDKVKSKTWKDKQKEVNMQKIQEMEELLYGDKSLQPNWQQNGQTAWTNMTMPPQQTPQPVEDWATQSQEIEQWAWQVEAELS